VRQALAEEALESGGVLDRLARTVLEMDPNADVTDPNRVEATGFAHELIESLELPEIVRMKDHRIVLSIAGDAGGHSPAGSGNADVIGCDVVFFQSEASVRE
jgi:hypothetical protein